MENKCALGMSSSGFVPLRHSLTGVMRHLEKISRAEFIPEIVARNGSGYFRIDDLPEIKMGKNFQITSPIEIKCLSQAQACDICALSGRNLGKTLVENSKAMSVYFFNVAKENG